jgi:hypothetical protein
MQPQLYEQLCLYEALAFTKLWCVSVLCCVVVDTVQCEKSVVELIASSPL